MMERYKGCGKSRPELFFGAFFCVFLSALFIPDYAIPQAPFYKGTDPAGSDAEDFCGPRLPQGVQESQWR